MTLHAGSDRRERIIVYGDSGSGKSSTYIDIANWLEKGSSKDRIYLLDNDGGWDANRDESGTLDKFFVVEKADVENYGGPSGWAAQLSKWRSQVKRDDWLVVDTMTRAWEGAQRYYWGKKVGNDSLADLWITHSATDVAGDHGANWGIINKFYGEFKSAVLNFPCHVLMVATSKTIRQPGKAGTGGDDLDTRTFYSGVEEQIEGQKDLRGDGHTVLYLKQTPKGYTYTTVKERGPIGRPKRENVKNKVVEGFVSGYLIPVAKWRP